MDFYWFFPLTNPLFGLGGKASVSVTGTEGSTLAEGTKLNTSGWLW